MSNEHGQWHNPENFDARFIRTEHWPWPRIPSIWKKTIYEFTLHKVDPSTFQLPGVYGLFVQADRHRQETDWGSIPPPLHGVFPPDEARPCYAIHDSGCRDGGLYVSLTLAGEYKFQQIARAKIDLILRQSLVAYGVSERRARIVYRAVRTYAVVRRRRK